MTQCDSQVSHIHTTNLYYELVLLSCPTFIEVPHSRTKEQYSFSCVFTQSVGENQQQYERV
jgi:hypothetical protein